MIRKIFGLCLSVSTDVGLGLLACNLILSAADFRAGSPGLQGLEQNWLYYLACCLFAVLPDVPGIIQSLLRESLSEMASGHRLDFSHHPLKMVAPILLVSFAAWKFGWLHLAVWLFLLGTCLLLHYIHDSVEGLCSGIAWLAPFYSRQISFCLPRNARPFPGVPLRIWTEKELKERHLKIWDWFGRVYQKVTVDSVFGVIIFTVALVTIWLRP